VDTLSADEERELNKWVQAVSEGYETKIDIKSATKLLKEVKQVLDDSGATFFLDAGTCLGAVRENNIIPWDDDIDIGSVIGLHGITEESLKDIVTTLRSNGFITRVDHYGHNYWLPIVKYSSYMSWTCFPVIDGHIVRFPSLKTPVSFFTNMKEITFLDDKFYVPNPPEEFLRLKYGNDWRIPKEPGLFENDVVNQLIANPMTKGAGRFRHLLARYNPWAKTCKIRVLSEDGVQVSGAIVIAIGLGKCKTGKDGCAEFCVPQDDFYPIIIRYGDCEKVDYLRMIKGGEEYIYRLNE